MSRVLALLPVAALVAACASSAADTAGPGRTFTARVVRVVDGDTFVARPSGSHHDVRVRIIGVDTPETVKPGAPVRCYGPQASALTKRLLPQGLLVRAAYEHGGRTDRYGRDLWDVWLPDRRVVAGPLASPGAARAYPGSPQTTDAAALRGPGDSAQSA